MTELHKIALERLQKKLQLADLAMTDRTDYYNLLINGLAKSPWGQMIEYIGQNNPKAVAKRYDITDEQAQELSDLVDDYIEITGDIFGKMEKEVYKASGPVKNYIRKLAL